MICRICLEKTYLLNLAYLIWVRGWYLVLAAEVRKAQHQDGHVHVRLRTLEYPQGSSAQALKAQVPSGSLQLSYVALMLGFSTRQPNPESASQLPMAQRTKKQKASKPNVTLLNFFAPGTGSHKGPANPKHQSRRRSDTAEVIVISDDDDDIEFVSPVVKKRRISDDVEVVDERRSPTHVLLTGGDKRTPVRPAPSSSAAKRSGSSLSFGKPSLLLPTSHSNPVPARTTYTFGSPSLLLGGIVSSRSDSDYFQSSLAQDDEPVSSSNMSCVPERSTPADLGFFEGGQDEWGMGDDEKPFIEEDEEVPGLDEMSVDHESTWVNPTDDESTTCPICEKNFAGLGQLVRCHSLLSDVCLH